MYRIVLYAVIYLPITSANPLTPPHPRFRSSLFPPLSFSFSLSLFFPFFFFSSFLFFSFLFFPPSLSLCVFVFIPIDHPFVSFPFLFLFFLSFVYLLRSPRFTLSTTTVPLATIRSLAFYTGQEDSYFFSYLTLSSCIGSAGHFFFEAAATRSHFSHISHSELGPFVPTRLHSFYLSSLALEAASRDS